MKILFALFLLPFSTITFSQENLNNYLSNHHFTFSLDSGINKTDAKPLIQKLSKYKIILQGEGGSHYLDINYILPLFWIKFLNENFGMTHFFLEGGHDGDLLINNFFQTGQSSLNWIKNSIFWKGVYEYNLGLPNAKKLKYFGIDHEQKNIYLKSLKLILPPSLPPTDIQPFIDLIKNTSDTIRDCKIIYSIHTKLKKALSKNKPAFEQYLGDGFKDFERIVLNKLDCKEILKNKNRNMAKNFLNFDNEYQEPIYFGELGGAHTFLRYRTSFGSIINDSEKFKNKIAVVNLYCYQCTTKVEEVSNWQLKEIDTDIQKYFLPFCHSDFTFFDLSGNEDFIKKYRAFGQILIVAKNQH